LVVCFKAFGACRARQHHLTTGADAVADLVAFAEPQGAPTGTSTVTPCRRGATYSSAPYSRIPTSCCHVADRGHCLLGDVVLRPRPGIAQQQAAGSRPCSIRAHLDKTNPPGHLYRPEPLWADPPIKPGMLPTCVNRLSPQTILRVPAVCLPLLGGQNGGEGDNMRVRLRLVGPSRCAADLMNLA
jgi:hypothetical protein